MAVDPVEDLLAARMRPMGPEGRPGGPAGSLNEAIGRKMHSLRMARGWSQAELAQQASRWGLRWSKTTVAYRERGQRGVSAEELLVLPAVFGVPLSDFVSAEESVTIGEAEYAIGPGSLLYEIASGEVPHPFESAREKPEEAPVLPPAGIAQQLLDQRRTYIERWFPSLLEGPQPEVWAWVVEVASRTVTNRAVARDLDLDPFEVALLSYREWNQIFEAERDQRAEIAEGTGGELDRASLQARRGVVTRDMTNELRRRLLRVEARHKEVAQASWRKSRDPEVRALSTTRQEPDEPDGDES